MPKTVAIKIKRPSIPQLSFDEPFAPDKYMREWLFDTFVSQESKLYNPEHDHLTKARVGCLWTSVENTRQGKHIVGQCEYAPMIGGSLGKWQKARIQQQLFSWFGTELDFLLTFDAAYMAQAEDASFCLVGEHELYHCGIQYKYGLPQFRKNGLPKFGMRAHDVEEFVGIVWRYGTNANPQGEQIMAMARAAMKKPAVGAAEIKIACGTCIG
jgi:hypothetical protein